MAINDHTDHHIRAFFVGHPIAARKWPLGPARDALPNLRILEIAPGPRLNQWTYVTAGAWETCARPFEFMAIGDAARDCYVELLTMVAFYAREHNLGLGHTIPIGRPLLEGSACEHVYLSLPYVYGAALEVITVAGGDHHILWLFPITEAEKRLLLDGGLDALEEQLEAQGVHYWSPFRKSVA
jgi:hypothetical protein